MWNKIPLKINLTKGERSSFERSTQTRNYYDYLFCQIDQE